MPTGAEGLRGGRWMATRTSSRRSRLGWTGQLLREHLRVPRGWHRIEEDADRPARTPPKTLALLAAAKRAGASISTICDHIHQHDGAARRTSARRQQECRASATCPWPQLGRIMKGMHCPSLERATALAQVLGMPVEELFTIKVKTRLAE